MRRSVFHFAAAVQEERLAERRSTMGDRCRCGGEGAPAFTMHARGSAEGGVWHRMHGVSKPRGGRIARPADGQLGGEA